MRLLVFGSRTFGVIKDPRDMNDIVRARLQVEMMIQILSNIEYDVLVHGGAKGADEYSQAVTKGLMKLKGKDIEILTYRAQWDRYGKGAGPFRNRQMIVEGKPDQALGFIDRPHVDAPISPGSKNMYQQLKNNGIKVELFQ